jgi:hypothetical protein
MHTSELAEKKRGLCSPCPPRKQFINIRLGDETRRSFEEVYNVVIKSGITEAAVVFVPGTCIRERKA